MRAWTIEDADEHYQVPFWGKPFFGAGQNGNLFCAPAGDARRVDLGNLMAELVERGIEPPILLRFNDILAARVAALAGAFQTAQDEAEYPAPYTGVLPIKVNQQRHVVEEVVSCGAPFGFGLEAGSKPELLVAIAHLGDTGRPIVCNGYKDREYIDTALLAQALGARIYLVVDRFAEAEMIIARAKALRVTPRIGLRAKLATRGAGKWQESGGVSSKFGLTSSELLRAVEMLKRADLLDCLELLHFHIGSQITAIRSVKDAIAEAARLYGDLRELGAASLSTIDVGGGLAVDYDGSKTNFHSSRNYSMQEYANDIVWALKDICAEIDQPAPAIISESGRALVAHHAVLVFNTLGTNRQSKNRRTDLERLKPDDADPPIVQQMFDALENLGLKNVQENFNDAVQLAEESTTLFRHGHLGLKSRAKLEDLFYAICNRVQSLIEELDYVPDGFDSLERLLCDTVYCNFSVFQSLPDAWAVDQLFPILPLQRLDERPTRPSVIADLTCDSDGCVAQFIDLHDVKRTLLLHEQDDRPYYLGAFLVGAYQETLGDLHNLFGDTNAVHISLSGDGHRIEHLVEGDRTDEVLSYVEYERSELVRRVRRITENAVNAGQINARQSGDFMRVFEDGLSGYTYLED